MDNRPNLIERAAARLRDSPKPEPEGVVRTSLAQPIPIPTNRLFAKPLKRNFTLDRGHLAAMGIIMPWSSTARAVEEFRIVKRKLMLQWQTPEYLETRGGLPRVVMVTSSKPREGKTFISINLALAFAAEENLNTILIDADPIRGDTAKTLKTDVQPGFTEVLAGQVPLEEALVQTDLPNLLVLAPGAHGPHVPELLSGRAPGVLFDQLAARYPEHVIVLDAPPCLASTDPAGFAPLVSDVVFVIEAERTQRPEVETSVSLLSACPRISFLLNKAPRRSSEQFGSYSYYYAPPKIP